jgi:predicted metal-dependent peptidase
MKTDINNLVIHLLLNKRDSGERPTFYGYFLMRIRKSFSEKLPAPAGISFQNGNPVMIFNMPMFDEVCATTEQKCGVLIHEVEHLIREHIGERKPEDVRFHRISNIAMDWAINQYIPELKGIGIQHNDMIKVEELKTAKEFETYEYYFQLLKQAKEQWDKDGGNTEDELAEKVIDDHSELNKDKNNADKEQLKEWLKDAMKDSIRDAGTNAGNVPNHIRQLYNELVNTTVPWKQQLRKFTARCSLMNKQSTRKKRNRRYGLYQPGKKKNTHLNLALCIDESGSIGENEFQQFFGEIDKISDYATITVFQCDTQVNKHYEYRKGQSFERTGQGGTLYNPMIEAAEKLEVDAIIIFGDMDCFEDNIKKPKVPLMWATIRGNKPPVDWGYRCEIEVKG